MSIFRDISRIPITSEGEFFVRLFNPLSGVVVITPAPLHSAKPELICSTGSNLARSVSDICDGENL